MRFATDVPSEMENVDKQDSFLSDVIKSDEFILIILDACRYDALKHFISERGLPYNVDMLDSEVHNTHTWVRTKWSGSYPITYISRIPYISNEDLHGPRGGASYKASTHFKKVVHAWEYGTGEASDPISTVEAALDNEDSKMIIHFAPPHFPHKGEPPLTTDDYPGSNLSQIGPRAGREHVSKSYYGNLERVWDNGVEEILNRMEHNNIIVTSDHGEAIGEGGRYGHNSYTPEVQTVPWVKVR